MSMFPNDAQSERKAQAQDITELQSIFGIDFPDVIVEPLNPIVGTDKWGEVWVNVEAFDRWLDQVWGAGQPNPVE